MESRTRGAQVEADASVNTAPYVLTKQGLVGPSGVAIQLRDSEFVLAARGLGASELRILVAEVLPNKAGPLILIASFDGAQGIMWEAALSFLGMGVQPPSPSFGTMLREAQNYLAIQPWLAVITGITVSAVILGLNLFGDALGDYYNRGSE